LTGSGQYPGPALYRQHSLCYGFWIDQK